MRFEETITRPIYKKDDWPRITGAFGITSDLIDGRCVFARSHSKTIKECEEWAKWTAKKNNKPIRWRVFTRIQILACGIEYPNK